MREIPSLKLNKKVGEGSLVQTQASLAQIDQFEGFGGSTWRQPGYGIARSGSRIVATGDGHSGWPPAF